MDDGFEADDCKLSGGDCGSCDQAEDDCPEEGLDGLDRLEGECKWGIGIVEPRRRGGHGGLSVPSGATAWLLGEAGWMSNTVSTRCAVSREREGRKFSGWCGGQRRGSIRG